MALTIWLGAVSFALVYIWWQVRALRQNLAIARQSGLPVVVAPVYFQSLWWMVLGPACARILERLPPEWSSHWLPLSLFSRVWHVGYTPFQHVGSDTFIMVSSGGNILWTCDPDAITQFSKNHHAFVKPVEMMGMLNMYGPTITATEGGENRLYRKIASPSFNERTHGAAWTESLSRTSAMLKIWSHPSTLVSDISKDLAEETLSVISSVCFDRPLDQAKEPAPDCSLTYTEAIRSMLDNIPILFTVPKLAYRILPFGPLRKAQESYNGWKSHMEIMRDETAQRMQENGIRNDASVLGKSLTRLKFPHSIPDEVSTESFVQAGQPTSAKADSPAISPSAVLGNIFIFTMAGYETTANTLTFAMTLLACRPQVQRAMQADIDTIVAGRGPSEWTFDTDFPRLMDGYVGAVMNETLRVYTVLPFLPKTTRDRPQSITLRRSGAAADGPLHDYTVPPHTLILMDTSAAHRNPKYWPAIEPTGADGPPYPVSSWDPARWLSPHHRTPTPGSYIPFADGPRSCIGKRFAQASFCAVIAAIFSQYTAELVVEDGREWSESLRNAERQLSDGVGFMMSLKMDRPVPLRLVKR